MCPRKDHALRVAKHNSLRLSADRLVASDREKVRFGSLADILRCGSNVRFTPESGHVQCTGSCPLCANSGHSATQSITSSARATNVGGTMRPSVLAVLRLMTKSNLVGCKTGRSAGFSPLRMRATYPPTCRYASVILGP